MGIYVQGAAEYHRGMQFFLSDPSPIIGYACHSLPNWLTDCRLVNLIDVTLACEDGNSKLVEVVAVAEVDSEKVLTIVWYRFVQDCF